MCIRDRHIKSNKGTGVLTSTCSQEEFCAYLKNILKSCQDDQYIKMFDEIENSTFMPKQVTKDNGVIPMQVNEKELVAILDNAKEYLPFLQEKDSTGKSVYDKLIALDVYKRQQDPGDTRRFFSAELLRPWDKWRSQFFYLSLIHI